MKLNSLVEVTIHYLNKFNLLWEAILFRNGGPFLINKGKIYLIIKINITFYNNIRIHFIIKYTF
jgi:hypothetical protein